MLLKPGIRLWNNASSVSVVVVRAPAQPVRLTCDERPFVADEHPPGRDATGASVILLGKRYADRESGLEVLCTRAGAGVLAVDGRPLQQLGVRTLPASD
jgi:hypothetical protein